MAFTAEQLEAGCTYALAYYQRRKSYGVPAVTADQPKRGRDELERLMRSQMIGFGLIVATVLAAGYAAGQLLGVW